MEKHHPEPESIRFAMDQAWRDHHHARDQTWKAVQAEIALAAGMVGVDVQFAKSGATIAAGALLLLATIFGMCISLHHRKLEIRKFKHIMNCEKALGLHRSDLISDVALPRPIRIWDIFLIWKTNTALFILRMHFSIAVFAVLFVFFRWTH